MQDVPGPAGAVEAPEAAAEGRDASAPRQEDEETGAAVQRYATPHRDQVRTGDAEDTEAVRGRTQGGQSRI